MFALLTQTLSGTVSKHADSFNPGVKISACDISLHSLSQVHLYVLSVSIDTCQLWNSTHFTDKPHNHSESYYMMT